MGFGHYYKLAQTKQVFEELDAFIRSRLRRYIQRNKNSKDKQGNLILTNASLKSMGLKSLTEIYQKYTLKKNLKLRKSRKSKTKTGKRKRDFQLTELEKISSRYRQKQILLELKELTTLVKNLEKKIRKIEKKL